MTSPHEKAILHIQLKAASSRTVYHRQGQKIVEGKLATVHVALNCSRGESNRKWLVKLVRKYTTELSAMATCDTCPAGEDHLDMTVDRVVNSGTDYVFVNRVYE